MTPKDKQALQVACPYCGAQVGEKCHSAKGDTTYDYAHGDRREAVAAMSEPITLPDNIVWLDATLGVAIVQGDHFPAIPGFRQELPSVAPQSWAQYDKPCETFAACVPCSGTGEHRQWGGTDPCHFCNGTGHQITGRVCSAIWLAKRSCRAWGAKSSHHGCKLSPGHDGEHHCPCGFATAGEVEHDLSSPDCRDGRQVWTVRWPCPVAQFDVGQANDGAALIALERRRQVESEGWTPDHDAEHADGALARAAIVYAAQASPRMAGLRDWWPWDASWLKVSDDPVRNLVKAGALIAAEIDRLQGGFLSARATIQVVPVVGHGDPEPPVPYVAILPNNVWLIHDEGPTVLPLDPLPTSGRDFAVIVRLTDD